MHTKHCPKHYLPSKISRFHNSEKLLSTLTHKFWFSQNLVREAHRRTNTRPKNSINRVIAHWYCLCYPNSKLSYIFCRISNYIFRLSSSCAMGKQLLNKIIKIPHICNSLMYCDAESHSCKKLFIFPL